MIKRPRKNGHDLALTGGAVVTQDGRRTQLHRPVCERPTDNGRQIVEGKHFVQRGDLRNGSALWRTDITVHQPSP